MEFTGFGKIPRLSRNCIITEKIDGTNAQITFDEVGTMFVGSRNRWITPDNDNYGFAKWAHENIAALREVLGEGTHFGEWWGQGIQRRYGMEEKVFSLFNTKRWTGVDLPAGVRTVPIIYQGEFSTTAVDVALDILKEGGSIAAPGYMRPEGIVIYHMAGNLLFKKTLENDTLPKGVCE